MKKYIIILLLLIPLLAEATTYYVANSGSNSNNGTSSGTPWQTISKVNSVNFTAGDMILFNRGDVWHETFTVPTSGTSSNAITFGAYGSGNNPIISGFVTLTGWTNYGGGIYSKVVSVQSMPNMVTLDGVNTPLGRTPNMSSISGWPSNCATGDSYSSTSMTAASLQTSPSLVGADIVMRSAQATNERRTITSHSSHTINWSTGTHDTPASGAGYFIENDISCLNVYGEWCYRNGTIYMYFGSDNPTNHTIKVSTLDNLVICSKDYITFDHLTVEGANNHGIDIQNNTYNIIQNCTIHNGGWYGIYGNACSYLMITLNTIDNNNNNGIYFENTCTHHTITYNTITNSGMILGMAGGGWSDGEAIAAEGSYGLISHNTINNQGYDGIRWGGANTEISYNFINHSCQNAGDGGGLYSYRDNVSGKVVKYNIIMNSAAQPYGFQYADWEASNGIYFDGDPGATCTYNTLINNQGAGIFVNSTQNVTVQHNTCYNNAYGIKIRSEVNSGGVNGTARGHVIDHNIFYTTAGLTPSDQFCLDLNTDLAVSDLSQFGTIDYNYFDSPVSNSAYIEWVYHDPSTTWADINLASWKNLYDSYDAHSVYATSTSTLSNVIYNETESNKSWTLSQSMVDIANASYSGTITLSPHTSLILLGPGTVTVTGGDITLPSVTTTIVSGITSMGAIFGGTVISNGGDNNASAGVVLAVWPDPTIDNEQMKTYTYYINQQTNPFFIDINSFSVLTPNTLYYYRAYITNSAGTTYGLEYSFTTSNTMLPIKANGHLLRDPVTGHILVVQ
jgi:parallel beta-helix repeat protein